MGALGDKARKAYLKATPMETISDARKTVDRNAKTAKVNLGMAEKQKASNILYDRMKLDRGKTVARGAAIEKIQAKKEAATAKAKAKNEATKRMNAATGNVSKAKAKPVAKTVSKTTAKAKPMNKIGYSVGDSWPATSKSKKPSTKSK